jgi:hypothetical protein
MGLRSAASELASATLSVSWLDRGQTKTVPGKQSVATAPMSGFSSTKLSLNATTLLSWILTDQPILIIAI